MIFLILFGLNGCKAKNEPGCHEILRIENKLDIDMYYIWGNCDGGLPSYNFMGQKSALLKSKSQVKDYNLGGFEKDFRYCPSLTLLFVDAKLLDIPYDTIRKNDMVLYRRSYTLEQLDSLNWIVTVP